MVTTSRKCILTPKHLPPRCPFKCQMTRKLTRFTFPLTCHVIACYELGALAGLVHVDSLRASRK